MIFFFQAEDGIREQVVTGVQTCALPIYNSTKIKNDFDFISNYKVLNLSLKDGYEPFLMIITPNFQCILSITGEKDKKILLMKCDEESLKISIELMHAKLNQANYEDRKSVV